MKKYLIDKSKVELLDKRFFEYIKGNSKVKESRYDFCEREVVFKCPCCEKEYVEFFNKGENKDDDLKQIQKCFYCHLYCIIRMNGELNHIKLFINIVGNELAKECFEELAKKNMLVALRLKLIVKELKNLKCQN